MQKLLPLFFLAACSRDMPQDKLLDILNQRAPLVAHIGAVTKVDVLSTAKAAANGRSCEVRLMHATGKRGATYVSFLRRDVAGATESALTWADERQAASAKMGEMLAEYCK